MDPISLGLIGRFKWDCYSNLRLLRTRMRVLYENKRIRIYLSKLTYILILLFSCSPVALHDKKK